MTATLKSLKAKFDRICAKRDAVIDELRECRANLEFPCGCGAMHKFKDCDVIQTHWYTPPRGCTEGDYWNEGELQIVCPDTGNRNRVLVFGSLEYLEDQFKYTYKGLFKSVVDNYYERELSGGHWNNTFLEKNYEYYGLEVKKCQ